MALSLRTALTVNGEYRIPAPREQVWQAMRDVRLLGACVPDCTSLAQAGPRNYEGRIRVDVGAVAGAFHLSALVTAENAPQSVAVTVRAHDPAAGWLDCEVTATLPAESGATIVGWRAAIEAGGPLASAGARLLHERAVALAAAFFANFAALVAAMPAEEPAAPPPPPRRRWAIPARRKEAAPKPRAVEPEASGPAFPPGPDRARQLRIIAIGAAIWLAILTMLFLRVG